MFYQKAITFDGQIYLFLNSELLWKVIGQNTQKNMFIVYKTQSNKKVFKVKV